MKDAEGVGTCIFYKMGQQLFRRNTRGAGQECFRECELADDVALLATTCEAAVEASRAYQAVAHALGLTVTISKSVRGRVPATKSRGRRDRARERAPVLRLKSLLSGLIDAEEDRRITNASKAFGTLRQAVFNDNINTKGSLYRASLCTVSAPQ